MKLYELLDVYDYNRESKIQKIQICRPNSDWEDWEEVLAGSVLLLPLYNAKVKDIGAAGENIIRVDIEWDKKIFDWGERMKKRTYEEMVAYIEGYNACFEQFCECFKGRKSLMDAIAKMRKIKNEVNKIVEKDEAERKES